MSRDASQIKESVIAAADAFTAAYDEHRRRELDLLGSTEAELDGAWAEMLAAQTSLLMEVVQDDAAMSYFSNGIADAIRAIKADRIG